ncbi:MAG: GntR family transcriptional regulator [Rhodospirillaceae bacterium]|nr:GntR family transcriptional regulator [Rhodospirillaceae bacterium]
MNRKAVAGKAAKGAAAPSRLQSELAARILRLLKEQGSGPGYHLVELDLCEHFGVSRTPIRGALKILAAQGAVEARANRGFVLREPITAAPTSAPVNLQDEEDKRLFIAIAKARNTGDLPAECTQQEIVRLFDVKLSTVVRVLRQLAELGLVERKAGNGWSFNSSIDSEAAQAESYAFRNVIEPAALLQPTFKLDRAWLRESRARHLAFQRKRWRPVMAVEFYEMNSDFHEQLARCSGNRYFLSVVQQQNQLRSFLNFHWIHGVGRVLASIEEHVAIMDALETGDNEYAAALMRSHLGSSKTAYRPLNQSEFGSTAESRKRAASA